MITHKALIAQLEDRPPSRLAFVIKDVFDYTKSYPAEYVHYMREKHAKIYDRTLDGYNLLDANQRVACLTELARQHMGNDRYMFSNADLKFDLPRCTNLQGMVNKAELITMPLKAAMMSIDGFKECVCDLFLNPAHQPVNYLEQYKGAVQ